jgi:ribulose-phosphate 3-epimerase
MKNNNNYKVLPSILAADFGKFIDESKTVDIPEVDYLHLDIMDGHFVPNLTIGPKVVESLKKHTRFKLDVHLMISNASVMIPQFADAGSDIITIHQEAFTHLHRGINQIKTFGIKAGVSINPTTPLEAIRWILDEIDLVLIMSVNPGFGGQKFIESSVKKVKELNEMRTREKTDFIIEIDGGIDPVTCKSAYLAGARYFVAGKYIFHQDDRSKAVRNIINVLQNVDTEIKSIQI